MDFTEPEHITLLRDSLARFLDQHAPRESARLWDKEDHFPEDVFKALGEAGMMSLVVPEEYGGAGRDILACMVVIEELSKRSMAVAVPYIMSACYAGMNLTESGSDQQKQDLLPKVANGEIMFAYGWTEPDVGSDVASVKTTAKRKDGKVIINGSKRFCTGGGIADYLYTVCNSDPQGDRYKNLSIVLIPKGTPGFEVQRMDMMGFKGAGTTDITLDDVEVPEDHILGGPEGWNQGWGMIAGPGLDVEKLEVAAMALGLGQAAFDDAWTYAEERIQFGKAVSTYQSIRHKLADMKTALHASRLMLYHAAWMATNNIRAGVETSMTKLFVTEQCKWVCQEAQTIMGAYGYSKEFDAERYVRDSLLMPIIGGTSAIQRNNIVNWSGLAKR